MPQSTTAARRLRALLYWAAATLAFAIIHNKAPLYSSNETTKLLHGIALAGRGDLSADWFAGTTDPLPFFSYFIAFTYKYLGESFFYLYHAALLGVYLYSIVAIFSITEGLDRDRPRYVAFLAVAAVLYSRFFDGLAERTVHLSLYSLVTGVAGQYLTTDLFQNSLFGVFIALSIALFMKKRPGWAAVCLGVACTVHSAYLFGAAALTIAYMIRIYRDERSLRKPILLGAFTLLLVAPILIHTYGSTPVSSDPETSNKVLSIIVTERIPHHSLPTVWLDGAALIKIAIVVAAIFVNLRNPLFEILLVPFLFAALGTILQAATGNLAIALIAPWRASVFLVPLATLSLCAAAIRRLFGNAAGDPARPRGKLLMALSAAAIAAAFAGGLYTQISSFNAAAKSPVRRLESFVDSSRRSGDLYLVDPEDSSLESFRILAGAPIVVNWKSHPYKDAEVLEWRDRFEAAKSFYEAGSAAAARLALSGLEAKYGVTHVVAKSGAQPWIGELGLEKAYVSGRYALYRLPAKAESTASK